MSSKLEGRVSKHDVEIAAIRKLILTGMKLLTATQAEGRKLQAEVKKLAVAQRETEKTLNRFISMERGGSNGHAKTDLR